MVPSIARQSVMIKCNMQKSVLTGNYEFYYAAGLLSKLAGIEIADEIRPLALSELLKEKAAEVAFPKKTDASADAREEYLKKMLLEYMPSEEYDGQMKELLLWGKNEPHLWIVQPV